MQLLVVILSVFSLLLGRSLTTKISYFQLGVLILLAAVHAFSGHAAAYGNLTVQEMAQFIHLLCTAVWSGSIFISGLIVLSENGNGFVFSIRKYGIKLSSMATWAVAGVILTGIYNAYFGLGRSITSLVHTQWGDTLSIKAILVIFALVFGIRNRYLLGRSDRDWNSVTEARFVRCLRIKSMAMILILIVSAWLANSPLAS